MNTCRPWWFFGVYRSTTNKPCWHFRYGTCWSNMVQTDHVDTGCDSHYIHLLVTHTMVYLLTLRRDTFVGDRPRWHCLLTDRGDTQCWSTDAPQWHVCLSPPTMTTAHDDTVYWQTVVTLWCWYLLAAWPQQLRVPEPTWQKQTQRHCDTWRHSCVTAFRSPRFIHANSNGWSGIWMTLTTAVRWHMLHVTRMPSRPTRSCVAMYGSMHAFTASVNRRILRDFARRVLPRFGRWSVVLLVRAWTRPLPAIIPFLLVHGVRTSLFRSVVSPSLLSDTKVWSLPLSAAWLSLASILGLPLSLPTLVQALSLSLLIVVLTVSMSLSPVMLFLSLLVMSVSFPLSAEILSLTLPAILSLPLPAVTLSLPPLAVSLSLAAALPLSVSSVVSNVIAGTRKFFSAPIVVFLSPFVWADRLLPCGAEILCSTSFLRPMFCSPGFEPVDTRLVDVWIFGFSSWFCKAVISTDHLRTYP